MAQLLKAGVSVITSVNLQHIEEKREKVEAITGKHVTDTVPLSFLQTADKIVVVDAPPENCMGAAVEGNANSPSISCLSYVRSHSGWLPMWSINNSNDIRHNTVLSSSGGRRNAS